MYFNRLLGNVVLKLIFAVISFSTILICQIAYADGSNPLNAALKEIKFTSLTPPRDEKMLGAIISFDSNGAEKLIADSDFCFPKLAMPTPVDAALNTQGNSVEYRAGVSGYLGVFLRKIGVSFDEKSDIATKTIVHFSDPKFSQLAKLRIREKIDQLDKKSSCYREMTNESNFIVTSVLSVSSFKMEFHDESSHALKVSGNMLGKHMRLSPELQRQYQKHNSLSTVKPMTIGYRVMKLPEVMGLNSDAIPLRELSMSEVEEYRASFVK